MEEVIFCQLTTSLSTFIRQVRLHTQHSPDPTYEITLCILLLLLVDHEVEQHLCKLLSNQHEHTLINLIGRCYLQSTQVLGNSTYQGSISRRSSPSVASARIPALVPTPIVVTQSLQPLGIPYGQCYSLNRRTQPKRLLIRWESSLSL